jgi:hypothetical protein
MNVATIYFDERPTQRYEIYEILYTDADWPLRLREEHSLNWEREQSYEKRMYTSEQGERVWRSKTQSGKLRDFYSFPDIHRVIKWRRMKFMCCVRRMKEWKILVTFWWYTSEETVIWNTKTHNEWKYWSGSEGSRVLSRRSYWSDLVQLPIDWLLLKRYWTLGFSLSKNILAS